MIKRRGKKIKIKYKFFILFCCFLLIVVGALLFFINCIKPIMVKSSEAQVRSSTSRAVNSAVQTVISESNVYDDLIEITTDQNGKIIFIQVKSLMVNKLAKEVGKVAGQNLDLIKNQGVSIPLGTLSGVSFLVGVGPDITFHIMAIATIHSKFSSEFTSAGINQTNHRIYLNIQTDVELILPTATKSITVNSHILICEAILVGDIPSTYLNSDSLDEMMNLIPD